MMDQLKKFNPFSNDIIFIDGLWGTGKSIIAPIVGSMEGVEKQKIEHIYEYLCVLRYLNKIEPDAVEVMLKTYADLSQYNNLIGREVNLRWNDDSGPRNNPNSIRYIKRIFGKEGDSVVEEINQKNLALLVMSHMVLPTSQPLVEAYGNRLKVIEMVRHPLHLVEHWYSFLSKFDSDRVFTLSFDYQGHKVPWFASKWKDKYIEMTIIDRVLYSIICLYDLLFDSLSKIDIDKPNTLVISFESFVMNTKEELERLHLFLGRSHSLKIKKILKQQKIPRKQLSMGKGHTSYGWSKSDAGSEYEEYNNKLKFIENKGSKDILERFDALIKKYNQRWPSVLSHFN